ncbi:MGMT family protein [bacterium]|nr:MAG: MGMT family protein [bacterium]
MASLAKTKLNFRNRVLFVVSRIPRGQMLTYQEVAGMVGNPAAARAVGNIMSRNHDPKIPCHRVIRSDGKIGGYNRGRRAKVKILRSEGAGI